MKRDIIRRGAAVVVLASVAAPMALAASGSYPPNVLFSFGSMSISANSGTATYCGFPNGLPTSGRTFTNIAFSSFKGSGGTAAKISFGSPVWYTVQSDNDFVSVLLGGSALLTYTSPGGGTITFELVSNEDGVTKSMGNTYPFAVESMQLTKQGNSVTRMLILLEVQFPNCDMEVQGNYR